MPSTCIQTNFVFEESREVSVMPIMSPTHGAFQVNGDRDPRSRRCDEDVNGKGGGTQMGCICARVPPVVVISA